MSELNHSTIGAIVFVFQKISPYGYFVYGSAAVFVYLFLPRYLQSLAKRPIKSNGLLLTASSIFFLSLFVPSPLIHGQNTQFCTHLLGGGIFAGLVWLFVKQNIKWPTSPLTELLTLYLLASGLGVANELFEFFMNGVGLIPSPSNDTWWDLFANTLGATGFWLVYKLTQKINENHRA